MGPRASVKRTRGEYQARPWAVRREMPEEGKMYSRIEKPSEKGERERERERQRERERERRNEYPRQARRDE